MWSFASNAFAAIGLKKTSSETNQPIVECLDDEVCSNTSREEEGEEDGLECPICFESFNIVENVPYVLWCGHTLCENCVLGLQCIPLKFPTQKIKFPFLISCPWCHLLSLRLVYKGSLKFPRKNFFLLWMVESLNGDRVKFSSSSYGNNDNQPIWSPKGNLILGNQVRNCRRAFSSYTRCPTYLGFHDDDGRSNVERHPFSLHKSLDCFVRFTSKFPLVVVFLVLVFFGVPASAVIFVLYLLITVLFAIPSFLVLYFAYPTLARLVKEIIS